MEGIYFHVHRKGARSTDKMKGAAMLEQVALINIVALLTGHSAEDIANEWCNKYAQEWRESL